MLVTVAPTDADRDGRAPGSGRDDTLHLWLLLVEQRARADHLAAQLHAITSSRSWRLTAPLRQWSDRLRGGAPRPEMLRAAEAHDADTLRPEATQMFPPAIQEWLQRVRDLPRRGGRLLVDVTEVDLEDLGAGIQRVTRQILVELLFDRRSPWLVVPVRLSEDGRYCAAWRFAERLLGLPEGSLGAETPVPAGEGDTFLGLDFCRRHHRAFGQALSELRGAGVHVVVVVYDLLPWTHPQWFPEIVAADYRAWLVHVARHAQVALCISRATQQDLLVAFEQMSQPFDGRTSVLPLGADALDLPPHNRVNAGTPVALLVGTIEPRKGHAHVLDAFEALWAQGHSIDLVLVGRPGWHAEALQERIRRHPQLGRSLFWHESAADTDIARQYSRADLLVMASEGEGYGLPLAEGAHAGCRLLARDLPVFREIAGERAAYFGADRPLTSALAAFLQNPAAWPDPQPHTWDSWHDSAQAVLSLMSEITSVRMERASAGVEE